jgi:hypothetical protein
MPTTYRLLGQKAASNSWTDLYVPELLQQRRVLLSIEYVIPEDG